MHSSFARTPRKTLKVSGAVHNGAWGTWIKYSKEENLNAIRSEYRLGIQYAFEYFERDYIEELDGGTAFLLP
jgi:hypothetical protein